MNFDFFIRKVNSKMIKKNNFYNGCLFFGESMIFGIRSVTR